MAQIKVVTVDIGDDYDSFALGRGAATTGGCGWYATRSLALGVCANACGSCASVAIGYGAMTAANYAVAVGHEATSHYGYAVVVGAGACASHDYSIILGYGANDADRCTTAIAFSFGPCGSHRVSVPSNVWIDFCQRLNNGCI